MSDPLAACHYLQNYQNDERAFRQAGFPAPRAGRQEPSAVVHATLLARHVFLDLDEGPGPQPIRRIAQSTAHSREYHVRIRYQQPAGYARQAVLLARHRGS